MRKRKVSYPAPKTATRQARPNGEARARTGAIDIDMNAVAGQPGLSIGTRVRIIGNGLYANQTATIESFAAGIVSAARVRTESGQTRQVRTIDLEVTPEER